jgi:hypothetical protein
MVACGKKNCGSEEVEFSELQTLNSLHIMAGEWGRVHIWISDSRWTLERWHGHVSVKVKESSFSYFAFSEKRPREVMEKRERKK